MNYIQRMHKIWNDWFKQCGHDLSTMNSLLIERKELNDEIKNTRISLEELIQRRIFINKKIKELRKENKK